MATFSRSAVLDWNGDVMNGAGDVAGTRATYAPHTETGFRAPANKTLLLLANGLLAKQGLRKARRARRADYLRTAT